jgi:hypothetical protein
MGPPKHDGDIHGNGSSDIDRFQQVTEIISINKCAWFLSTGSATGVHERNVDVVETGVTSRMDLIVVRYSVTNSGLLSSS